ncbi:hypothetical protein E2C01_008336 [Portunus trituberculatus]|uniref:Uncharacterized protein n=1 Tax=Portunus trituberculatus TaxID=210409 RepID=A0A5B7D1H8_PORTR|nr:hypothetical protein [Portunus trituberculatus]
MSFKLLTDILSQQPGATSTTPTTTTTTQMGTIYLPPASSLEHGVPLHTIYTGELKFLASQTCNETGSTVTHLGIVKD